MLPVRSARLTPGDELRRVIRAPSLTPLFLVGDDDRSRAWVSAGLIWPLAEKLTANLAYAQQFERPRVRQWTLGFKFDF